MLQAMVSRRRFSLAGALVGRFCFVLLPLCIDGYGVSMVDEVVRQRALQALRRKRSLNQQLRLYFIVNAILVLVWLGSGRGSFWPIYPIAFWGISLLIQGWSISHPDREFSEEEISREIERF